MENFAELLKESEAFQTKTVREDPRIKALITRANMLYSTPLKRHNDASHPLHALSFLCELGFTRKDGLESLYAEAMGKRTKDGFFTVVLNVSQSFGGTGTDTNAWMSCDAPLLTWCMVRLNEGRLDIPLRGAVDKILALGESKGWRCKVAPELGKFRGPGRKDDECPYATLLVLKLLTAVESGSYAAEKAIAIETILSLWEERKTRKPYLFGMGTDFAKPKFPFIWYDILHTVDLLSRFDIARKDGRFLEMNELLRRKVKINGSKPESIYTSWKDWDFGQKKSESDFIRFAFERIERRFSQ